MAFRTSSPGPSESVFSADESFTPLGSDFGTDGYEGARGQSDLRSVPNISGSC